MRDLVDVFAEAYAKTRNPFGMRRDPRDDYFDGDDLPRATRRRRRHLGREPGGGNRN